MASTLIKVGPHILDGTPDAERWARDATIVKVMDASLWLLDVVKPGTITIFRHYFPPGTDDLGRNGVDVANDVLAALGGRRPDYVELYNNDGAEYQRRELRLEDHLRIVSEAVPVIQATGMKVAAFSFSSGNPTQDDWDYLRASGIYPPFGGADAVALEEYWGNAVPRYTLDHALRHRIFWQPGDPPIIIEETGRDAVEGGAAGWRISGVSAQEYYGEIRDYDAELLNDPYVLGATVFTAGAPSGDWVNFNTDGELTDLILGSPGPGVTLEHIGPAVNPVGTQHGVLATVRDTNGNPVGGATVELLSNMRTFPALISDGAGQARWDWTSAALGNEVLQAQALAMVSPQLTKTWQAPATNIAITVETPPGRITSSNEDVNSWVGISGWAIDTLSPAGTGVDAVDIYLDGPAGVGLFLGSAVYGLARPDVAIAYGPQFLNSGWDMVWGWVNPTTGPHTLYVYARSTATGQWTELAHPFYAYGPGRLSIDFPGPRELVSGIITIRGWALDRSGPDGSGPEVDAVHIYMDGSAGAGVFLGSATYGLPRPDVATAYGRLDYTNSGFELAWDTRALGGGVHTLYVYAASLLKGGPTPFFLATRTVIVVAPIISQVTLEHIGPSSNPIGTQHGVLARVLDQNGLPIEGVTVTLTSNMRTFPAQPTDALGYTSWTWTGDTAGDEVLQVTAGGVPAPSLIKSWPQVEPVDNTALIVIGAVGLAAIAAAVIASRRQ